VNFAKQNVGKGPEGCQNFEEREGFCDGLQKLSIAAHDILNCEVGGLISCFLFAGYLLEGRCCNFYQGERGDASCWAFSILVEVIFEAFKVVDGVRLERELHVHIAVLSIK